MVIKMVRTTGKEMVNGRKFFMVLLPNIHLPKAC